MILQNDTATLRILQKMLHPRPADGHKGTFGHALLIAGSKGMAGAAILSAEACLRSGIGKLSVLTPEVNHAILQISIPEAILAPSLEWAPPYDAVGIGPGIGTGHEASEKVYQTLLSSGRMPMVLDADAINILAQQTAWQAHLSEQTILTPHPKEAERLTGACTLEHVAKYAEEHHTYIILKGHPTHVCTPYGEAHVLHVGNSGMATAGSGDVLTGIITGLLAQGYPPLEASLLGAWLHGTAGDFAADEMGENCMLARDIIRHMPDAFRELNTK